MTKRTQTILGYLLVLPFAFLLVFIWDRTPWHNKVDVLLIIIAFIGGCLIEQLREILKVLKETHAR